MLYPNLQYKKTAHVLHFILTLLTGGLWILPWVVCWAVNANHNSRVDQSMLILMASQNRNNPPQ